MAMLVSLGTSPTTETDGLQQVVQQRATACNSVLQVR